MMMMIIGECEKVLETKSLGQSWRGGAMCEAAGELGTERCGWFIELMSVQRTVCK